MAIWIGWVAAICLMVGIGSNAGMTVAFFVGGALVAVLEWSNRDAD